MVTSPFGGCLPGMCQKCTCTSALTGARKLTPRPPLSSRRPPPAPQADALEHALLAALPLGPQGDAGGVSLPDLFRGELQVGGGMELDGGEGGGLWVGGACMPSSCRSP